MRASQRVARCSLAVDYFMTLLCRELVGDMPEGVSVGVFFFFWGGGGGGGERVRWEAPQ